jgi:hypothetical protein
MRIPGDIDSYSWPGEPKKRGPYHKNPGTPPDPLLDYPLPETVGYTGPQADPGPESVFGKRAAVQDTLMRLRELSKEAQSKKNYAVFSGGRTLFLSATDILWHVDHRTVLGRRVLELLDS